jgi:hypothetical protein
VAAVESLLEKSLLRQVGVEEPRFIMLETIHEQEDQIAASLAALAGLAAMQGQPVRALRLAGAAAALRERVGWQPWPAGQASLTGRLAVAHAALSVEGQAAARADGQALTVEQAIVEALGRSHGG